MYLKRTMSSGCVYIQYNKKCKWKCKDWKPQIWLHQLIAKRRIREYVKSKRNVSGTDNPRTISFPIKEHIQESIMEYEVSEDSFVEIIPKPVFCVFPNWNLKLDSTLCTPCIKVSEIWSKKTTQKITLSSTSTIPYKLAPSRSFT
jgi:hypothetical protein